MDQGKHSLSQSKSRNGHWAKISTLDGKVLGPSSKERYAGPVRTYQTLEACHERTTASHAKALSSPSVTGMPEGEPSPFPKELQDKVAAIRGNPSPERWMCVVRREKMTWAVGHLVQLGKVRYIVLALAIPRVTDL
ncbi:hypothetical protein BDZ97DRAFT_1846990 [Flammula alnicola]|nr:hypothetical protein BDZ97DRAFT_1846990 [Flammula alnicola]